MTATGVLITARLKSTRLPLKVMRELRGRPMIEHLVERLKLIRSAGSITLCTSPNPQDDPLAEVAQSMGINCFRGHPDDVLLRLTEAAKKYGLDTVISCTADNPFVDPVWAEKLLAYHLAGGFDFSRINGLPFGTFSYALRRTAMERACAIKDAVDTEVWGGYFTQSGLFKNGVLEVEDPEFKREHYRLTVDTPDDWLVVERIFAALWRSGEIFSLAEIIAFLDRHPEVRALNQHVRQLHAKPPAFKKEVLL